MAKKEKKEYIDYGEWNVPTSWNDITLKMYQEIERYYDGKDSGFDAREVLNIITGKSIDEINALPAEFLEIIMNKLSFLQTQPETGEASNKVVINGETYLINVAEKLKTGEYVQADTIIKSDKHNYAAILGILCRKEGEKYDSKFEAEVLNSRIEMFENTPMVKLMPIVSFFLELCMIYTTPTLLSLKAREAVDLTRQHIESLHKNGEISKRSMKSQMKKLKKLEKSINSI